MMRARRMIPPTAAMMKTQRGSPPLPPPHEAETTAVTDTSVVVWLGVVVMQEGLSARADGPANVTCTEEKEPTKLVAAVINTYFVLLMGFWKSVTDNTPESVTGAPVNATRGAAPVKGLVMVWRALNAPPPHEVCAVLHTLLALQVPLGNKPLQQALLSEGGVVGCEASACVVAGNTVVVDVVDVVVASGVVVVVEVLVGHELGCLNSMAMQPHVEMLVEAVAVVVVVITLSPSRSSSMVERAVNEGLVAWPPQFM